MHSVCRCSLPVWRRSFLKKGTPRDLFLPRPGSAPGRIWPKNNNTCKGPWVLHPYQVSSKSIKRFWRRSWKCESLRTTTTDGWTDGRTTAFDSGELKRPIFNIIYHHPLLGRSRGILLYACWWVCWYVSRTPTLCATENSRTLCPILSSKLGTL